MFIEIDESVYSLLMSLSEGSNEWKSYWISISHLINLVVDKKHIVFFTPILCNALIESSKDKDCLSGNQKSILKELRKNLNNIYALKKYMHSKILVKDTIDSPKISGKNYDTEKFFIFQLPLSFFEKSCNYTLLITEDLNDFDFYDEFFKMFLKDNFSFNLLNENEDVNLSEYLDISFENSSFNGLPRISRWINSQKDKLPNGQKKFILFIFDNDKNEKGENPNERHKKNIINYCEDKENNISSFYSFKNIREMENLIPLEIYKKIVSMKYDRCNLFQFIKDLDIDNFYHEKLKKYFKKNKKLNIWKDFFEIVVSEAMRDSRSFVEKINNDKILKNEWKNLFQYWISWGCSLSEKFLLKIQNKESD